MSLDLSSWMLGLAMGGPWLLPTVLASSVYGFELPDNQANAFIFEAAMRMIAQCRFFKSSTLHRARLDLTDIEKVLPALTFAKN